MERTKLDRARTAKGMSQEQLAEALGVDVSTVSRWMRGECVPRGYSRQKLCSFFGMTASDLEMTEQTILRMPRNEHFNLLVSGNNLIMRLMNLAFPPHRSYQEVQHMMIQIIQDEERMNTHRDILCAALGALIALPAHSGIFDGTQHYEPMMTQCTAAVAACWELSRSAEAQDLSTAFNGVAAYLPILEVIIKESSQHRRAAANLAMRCSILKTILSWHLIGLKEALQYAQKPSTYSQEADDVPLQLSIYNELAFLYLYDKNPAMALQTIQRALPVLKKNSATLSDSIQRTIYSTLAVMKAKNGQNGTKALGESSGSLNSQSPDGSTSTFYTTASFYLKSGMVYYYQGEQEKANASLTMLIDPQSLESKLAVSELHLCVQETRKKKPDEDISPEKPHLLPSRNTTRFLDKQD